MGEVVGAVGVPHHPNFPALANEDTAFARELHRLYGEVGKQLISVAPDVLVIVSSDHFHHYFAEVPTFGIGVAEETVGPCDRPDSPTYKMSVDSHLAGHILCESVAAGFDVARSHEFALDHAFVVPYHFLASGLDVSIVPVFINGLLPPVPSAQRCFDIGQTIRDAIESADDGKRVAIVASGTVSLDLGGIHDGPAEVHPSFQYEGVPDSEWVDEVVERLSAGNVPGLVSGATVGRMASAGNIGAEFLNWIAMLGTFDAQAPEFVERQGPLGNVFAAWPLVQAAGQDMRGGTA
jgi:aromatic ring-opening dioxygenase catalytic subunit (LigB family)